MSSNQVNQTTENTPSIPLPPPRASTEILEQFLKAFKADDIALLAEQLRFDPTEVQSTAVEQTALVTERNHPAHLRSITRADIERNNKSLQAFAAHLPSIEIFRPELKDKSPAEVIQQLGEELKKDPSIENSKILQHAINGFTSVGSVDSHLKAEIDKATSILHKKSKDDSSGLDDIWVVASADAYYGGASIFADLPSGWIYWRVPYVGDSMNDTISSLRIFCTRSETQGGNVILFQDLPYAGNYRSYSIKPNRDLEISQTLIPYVGNDFNDDASAILIVRRLANENRISVGDLVPATSITDIVNAQDSVRARGDPIFSWDMWPFGQKGHPNDPSKMFIYLNVPISVNTHSIFGHYNCEVHYWIWLYVDGNGKIQGYVNWYNCWVEGGWITGTVLSRLMAKIPGTLGNVDSLIGQALDLANALGGPYSTLYYLPGRGGASGKTTDGVSLVAVKR